MTITNQHQLIKNSCYPEHVTQIQLNCDENVAYVMPPMKMSSCRISFGFMACVMWQITEFFLMLMKLWHAIIHFSIYRYYCAAHTHAEEIISQPPHKGKSSLKNFTWFSLIEFVISFQLMCTYHKAVWWAI